MRGKPASDKSLRKESEPNKGNNRPGIYDASVSFYGDNPPHGKLQEILVAEGERFGLSGVFEPPTVFKTAAINRSANHPIGSAERIRTPDLLLMRQASYQTAPPRNFSSVFCQRTSILSHTSSGKSRAKKMHPAVCGRQGVPLWRNESGFLPITAKSVGVRRCVGLRRRLCRLDGSRHL